MLATSAEGLRPNLRQMPNMSASLSLYDPPERAVKSVAGMNSKHQGSDRRVQLEWSGGLGL